MPKEINPERLTIKELKRELEHRGIPLPHSHAKKIEYVNLFKKDLNKQKLLEFSSDEEPTTRITRSYKKMETHTTDIKASPRIEMVKNLLVEDPVSRNASDSDITRTSPRRKKKPVRLIEEYDVISPHGVKESEEDPRNTEVRVHLEKLDFSEDMTVDGLDITSLTDVELRSELQKNGINPGPIIASTRRVYENKLVKVLSGAGDSPARIINGIDQYSDQDSASDDEDDVDVEDEPIVVETRKTRRSTTLQYSATKEFSSAPNLTALDYPQKPAKPVKPKRSPPIAIPKSKSHIKKPLPSIADSAPANSPAWVNISMSDDVNKSLPSGKVADFRSQSFNSASYEAFQRGVHTDKKHVGGVRGVTSHNSYIDVVNQSSAPSVAANNESTMSSLRLDDTSASDFSVIENDLENTLKNAEEVLNSTEISLKSFKPTQITQPSRPSTSHLARDLLSPNLSKLDYAKRIQRICGSATRRRPMRSEYFDRQEEEKEEEGTVQAETAPAPSTGEKTRTLKSDRKWVPVWVQILIVIALAVFFYIVVQSMESNPHKRISGV